MQSGIKMKIELRECVTSAYALGEWTGWASMAISEFQLALSYTVHLYNNHLPQEEPSLPFPFKLTVGYVENELQTAIKINVFKYYVYKEKTKQNKNLSRDLAKGHFKK